MKDNTELELFKEIQEHDNTASMYTTEEIAEIVNKTMDYKLYWNFKSVELHAKLKQHIDTRDKIINKINDFKNNIDEQEHYIIDKLLKNI